jgi:hypothetical protein
MNKTRFDVNDADLRDGFLRYEVVSTLAGLSGGAVAHWGRMTSQQMVEHLVWAVQLSTGRAQVQCATPAADLARLKTFLYHDRPTPHGFMNPALTSGLPPLRHATLDGAKTVLGRELSCFLEQSPGPETLRAHPVFGPIGHEEWHRAHYKHMHHHLLQFGLIEPE